MFSGQVSAAESPGTVVSAGAVIRSFEGRAVPAKVPCPDVGISRENNAFCLGISLRSRKLEFTLSEKHRFAVVRSCI